ncbi:hypothetical protein [Aquihabitans sp. McL0605]|uniref:hypothetical protein n=1 Tax=Aquihabitans sp. McL0605 TaxID=3415671 RepID=UPI003CFB2CF8
MLIWFAVLSVVLVAVVFKSPGIDYRTVVIGSILPVGEGLLGGPGILHSVIGAVAVLGIMIVATRNRRLLRRRLLGIPIGMMAHLVLDGSFMITSVFWWPLGGIEGADQQIPEWTHLGVSLVLELVGIGVGVWAYRWFGLDDPEKRRRFWTEGRLDVPT